MKKTIILFLSISFISCKSKKEIANHKIYKIEITFANGQKDTLSADIYGDPNRTYVWNGNLHYWKNEPKKFGILASDMRLASYVRSFKILNK